MTDRIRFDLSPRTEFADRLEDDLLRAIGDPASTPTPRATPRRDLDEEHIMTITLDPDVDRPATHRRHPWLTIAAAAAVLVLVVLGVWAVGRNDNGPAGTHDVSFTVLWARSINENECPSDIGSPMCAWKLHSPATAKFTGDISGNAYQSVVWGNSDGFPDRAVQHEEKAATYVFGGTVAGCGTGEFLMIETVQIASGPDRDYSKGTAIGTWQIVPDSGRGDLRGISGNGSSSGLAPDYDRSASGTVTCTPPKDLSANEIIAPLGTLAVPATSEEVTPDGGDLPNGTYRAEFSAKDLDRLEPDVVHDFMDGGAIELTLQDGKYTAQGFLPSGAKDGDSFNDYYQVIGDSIVWVVPPSMRPPNSDGIYVFEWSIDGDTVTFTQMDGKHREPFFAVPYSRVP
jgi:hypothetical protein